MKKGESASPEQLEKMRLGRERAARVKAERVAQAVAESGNDATPAPALGDPVPIAPPRREPEPHPEAEEPQGLDLSPEEMARIAEEVAKKVAQESAVVQTQKRREIIAKATELELQRQRREAGLTDHRDDLMEILIDVAPFADSLTWDGKVYQHGHWYKVSRRVYDSMRETMARSWDAEERAGNPNRKFRRDPMTGTTNPLIRELQMSDGSFTVYHETRVNARTGATSGSPPPGVA